MIDLRHWLAFVAASMLIAILPGPGVANIVGHAVNSGRRTAFAAIAGAVVGNLTAMTLSLAGVGTLLAGYPNAYRLIELAGAAYLNGIPQPLVILLSDSAKLRSQVLKPKMAGEHPGLMETLGRRKALQVMDKMVHLLFQGRVLVVSANGTFGWSSTV